MLALGEKSRTVVLSTPIKFDGMDQEIARKLEDSYLEVKARKEIFLTKADAERIFHSLPVDKRQGFVESFTRGLSEVVVLEHLDGDAIECMLGVRQDLVESGAGDSLYCSDSAWSAVHDLEFFFPHLDALPVERTLAVIKPDSIAREIENKLLLQVVEEEAAEKGLFVVGAPREMVLQSAEAERLCEDMKDSPDYNGALGVLQRPEGVIALCLEGRGAVNKWRLLCGPTSSDDARRRAPTTIRARWGTDSTSNAVHCSASLEAADKELKMLFPEGTLKLQRTLCIVKPDAMPSVLQIRMMIEDAGFTVLKEKQVVLTDSRAREFYRGQKDQPSFASVIEKACAGPCCIMVLCRLEAVSVLQQLMGPEREDEAKLNKPGSIRALYGQGQMDAVHGSATPKDAAREVQFFFPELGADPIPADDEVRDFLFRKSSKASMDLKSLPDSGNTTDFTVDPTLQQLLSRGLMSLCQVQPKGLAAVKWLSRWLDENNPNKSEVSAEAGVSKFSPPERSKKVVEYGVNEEGVPFAREQAAKPVVEVDVSGEPEMYRKTKMRAPPFVVFVVGGPGSGKGTQCTKLRDEFNLVHLSTGDIMREEVAAQTHLGTEIYRHQQAGTLVPDKITLELLKNAMTKHQDVNRFLLDGFPRSLEQAKMFEKEIAEVAFCLYFDVSPEAMRQRISARAIAAPGRVDDNPETVEKRLKVYEEQSKPVVAFYGPIGKLRKCNAEQGIEEVYAEAKRYFYSRFVYLVGPLGSPVEAVAQRLEEKYGYCCVNVTALLQAYGDSKEEDASTVKKSLATGKPVDPAIVCPLVLKEVAKGRSLGQSSFVLCDFPQTLKQAQFLEFQIPCVAKPLLLDFSRADAEDLAATMPIESDELEVETRIAKFFATEMQETLKSLPGLERIPLTFAGKEPLPAGQASLDAKGVERHLVDCACAGVFEKVKPGLTLVLGLPCSGAEALAPMLAELVPNSQAVDCGQLLDKELERKTEVGLALEEMGSRGQVVPLSVSLELLKKIVALTCSDALVVENCPLYADQIDSLTKEFRIDRVFYIAGDSKCQNAWKIQYLQNASGDDEKATRAKAFDERLANLEPIAAHFSRLGKLELLNVTATPTSEQLAGMIEQATMPQFAIITGASTAITPKEAEKLAKAYSAGTPLTAEMVVAWAKATLSETIDHTQPEKFLPALKRYSDSASSPFLVLDRYPKTADDAAAFVAMFGAPKLVANVSCENEEDLAAEYQEAYPDLADDDEQLQAKIQADKQDRATMVKALDEASPGCANQAEVKPEEMGELIKTRLMPQVYVLVCPSGATPFAGMVADAICAKGKYTVLDCAELLSSGGHTPELEAQLTKALYTAEAWDTLPAQLWTALFQEAFAKSSNPMGKFLVVNFPTPCSVRSSPTIRDQFCMLESVSVLRGILHVTFSEAAYTQCCSESPDQLSEYLSFEQCVNDQTVAQFAKSHICEATVEDAKNPKSAAGAVAVKLLQYVEQV